MHLADLETDMGEQHNLKDEYPELAAELKTVAEGWRVKIDGRWENYWLPKSRGTTTHPT